MIFRVEFLDSVAVMEENLSHVKRAVENLCFNVVGMDVVHKERSIGQSIMERKKGAKGEVDLHI